MVSYKGLLLTFGQTGQFYSEIVVDVKVSTPNKTHTSDWLNFFTTSNCYVLP